MNELARLLADRIRQDGPLPVSVFMAECLFHPGHGYYRTRQPFGRDGDFMTAPEISQMFGEIIGAWLANAWQIAGSPKPFLLVEIGPGRGTLMRDILRVCERVPDFMDAAQVVLIEESEALTKVQRATLGQHAGRIRWMRSVAGLPDLPLFLVSNELFDALPVRQFVKTGAGWRERVVALDDVGNLAFAAGATGIDPALLPHDAADAREGAIFETAPAREALQEQLAAHLGAHGGAMLAIDYGHLKTAIGDTLQAMSKHAYVDPLAAPGEADLTSHVDFEALASAASRAGAHPLPAMTQADFLIACGLLERAGRLGAGKDPATQDTIRAAVERLAGNGKDGMGDLFKVLCVTAPDMPVPPPFQPAAR